MVAAGEGKFGDFGFLKGTPAIGAPHQGKYVTRTQIAWNADAESVTNVAAEYLPVVKAWGFRADIDELVAAYNTKVRRMMLKQLD